MKKNVFTFALALLTAGSAWALEFQSEDFSYKVINSSEKTVEITDYLGYSTELTIPHAVTYNDVTYSVVSIGSEAFKQSAFLMTVSIPNSIKTIGTSAFSGCSSLTAINIPNSVTSIQASTFSDCSSLASINIPTPVTSIGDRAFYGCYSMTEVTIGNRVTSIGASAFEGCFSLTQITIPNSVTSIGSSAFKGCDALTQVNIGSSVTSIGESAFNGCSALTQVTIPNGVTSIGSSAFYSCSALMQVTIPDGVKSIGSSAFYGCSALTQVTIPNGVTSIESSTFKGCNALTHVTIGSSVKRIGESAFNGCSTLTEITIPNSVTSIGSSAFANCPALTKITIGNNVTSIGSSAFSNCTALEQITWNAINYADFYYYSNSPFYNIRSNITTFTFGEQVEHIPDYLCYDMDKLTQVTWNAINYADFKSIDSSPFYNSRSNITNFTFGDQVEHIPAYLCYGMDKLTQVTIGNSVTSMGDEAFSGCSAITQVTWNAINCADFKSSNYSPFYDSRSNITTFTFGDQVEHIPAYLCDGMDKLAQVTIGNNVTSIGKRAFYNCDALTQVTIPESVESIGELAFSGCSALTQVTIGNSVTSIGKSAFGSCPKLTAVYYTGDVAGWCGITFTGSTSNPLYYAHNLYIDNTLVTELVIPEGVTEIKDYAFYYYSALTQVTIGNGVTSIGERAFSGCYELREITVLATVPPTVGADAFYNVSRRIPVYVPAEALKDYQAADTWKEFYYLQAMPTSLQTPSMPESIRVYGGMLHNPQQLPVSLYDMQGRMVYSGTAATVSQPAGVYVLRCAGASSKVLF